MFIVLSLFIASFSPSTSYASNCTSCDQMTSLLKSGNVDQEVGYLSRFKFSTAPDMIQMEADAVTKFSLICIKKDVEGDAREFYYSIFNSQPQAMKEALGNLPSDQRAYLANVYKETKRLFKSGNGG